VHDLAAEERTLWEAITGLDSYILLFLLLVVDYLVVMLVSRGRWEGINRSVPVSLTALLALHTSGARKGMVRLAFVVVGLSIIVGFSQLDVTDRRLVITDLALITVLLGLSAVAIVRRILSHTDVTVETIFGAIDVYIVLGLFFGALFIFVSMLDRRPPFLAQPGFHPSSDYVYLSFVTLTTLGFGDLTPHTTVARSVVVLEALIGQIFLVTLVARLVSVYNNEAQRARVVLPRRRRRGGDGGEAPGPAGESG